MTGKTGRPAPLVEAVDRLERSVCRVEQVLRDRLEAVRDVDTSRPEPMRRALTLALIRIPGFLREFDKAVPASHLEDGGVRCSCGHGTVELDRDRPLAFCGGCDRAFLLFPDGPRVARMPGDEAAPDPCRCEDRRRLYEDPHDGTVRCANCEGWVAERVAA